MSGSPRPGRLWKRVAAQASTQDKQRSEVHSNGPNSKSLRQLSAWLDHFNAYDLGVLFRCSIAAWVASLLIFIGPSLHVIGTETFFACVVLILLPPSGIVFIFVLAALTLLMGMALAWAWGAIVMKAALAARPQLETQARLQALEKQAVIQANLTGQDVAIAQQELIYSGFMLDTGSTVVYFVLICLFIYFMARLRAKNPKFTLLQVFATIVSDLFLTIGPLYPSYQGLLPKALVEPALIGVGLGFAASILFFPETTSHTVLRSVERVAGLLRNLLDLTMLSISKEAHGLDLKTLQEVRANAIIAYKEIEPAIRFLPLDFSMGRWNTDDVKSLRQPIRRALLACLALLQFHISLMDAATKVEKVHGTLSREEKTDARGKKKSREVGKQQLTETADMVHALRIPVDGALWSETVETLRQPSVQILSVCQDALSITVNCIHTVNSRNWLPQPSDERFRQLLERSEKLLTTLAASRASFAADPIERLLETHEDIFDEMGILKPVDHLAGHPLRSVVLVIVFQERILGVADALLKLLAQIVALLQARTKAKMWFPTGLRYAMAWVFETSAVAPIPGESPLTDPDVADELSKKIQRQLHISQGYRVKQRRWFGKSILGTYHWFISAEGLYALRMVVITIALAIPAVISTSAGFYYREKCIWGLIMGQTTLMVYMPDLIFSVVSGALGTVIGGVLGLVAWYVGSGDGPGNPYGLAAVMAFTLIIILWGRLFFPPAIQRAVIMSGSTFLLIIGYSFDDTHTSQYSDPGEGYSVFYRRLLLVIVGFLGAIIIQMFPRPPAASRHICRSFSNIICSLADRYALMLSYWCRTDSKSSAMEIQLIVEKLSMTLAEELSSLSGPIALLRFEFSSSPFNSLAMKQVKSLCQDINQNLGRVLSLGFSLPLEFQRLLAQKTGMLDQRNISDIMAVFNIVEQALKTGDALPEVLPTPVIRRCCECWRDTRIETIEFSKDLVGDRNYRKFCVAVSSYLKFLEAVDELVLAMKGVLGETHNICQSHESMGNQV